MHNLNLNLPFGNKATPKHKLKKNITKYKCPVASSHCSECKKEIGKATIMATLILEKKKLKISSTIVTSLVHIVFPVLRYNAQLSLILSKVVKSSFSKVYL
jgi:hypothetical protein